MPFFRKKKKKELPKPPSFEKDDSSTIQGPPVQSGYLKPPEPKEYREKKEKVASPPIQAFSQPSLGIQDPPRKDSSQFQGPPRTQTPQYKGPKADPRSIDFEPPRKDIGQIFTEELEKYSGPPRSATPPPTTQSAPPHLPSPPPFGPQNQPSPPTGRGAPSDAPTPIFGSEDASDDILNELKRKSFGSGLAKAPEHTFERKSVDELTHKHFLDTKQEYIAAGNKHLELNLYDNAAINFACAIFCDLLSGGVESARKSINDLSSGVPSGVLDNVIFDNVRIVIDATRTKNFTFLTRAEKVLRSHMEQLYPEDAAIIERGLAAAKSYFGM